MTSSWSPIRTVRERLESRVMPRTRSVTIRGERIHAIHVLTPRRASRSMMARAIVVFPAPSGPTIAYTFAAHEWRDPVVSARSFDPLRSLRARFDFMGGFHRDLGGPSNPCRRSTRRSARRRRLAETRRGACPVLLSSEAAPPRNVKVIRPRPLFLLPTGRGEDFPVELQTSRRMRSLQGHPDHHTRSHDAVSGGTN